LSNPTDAAPPLAPDLREVLKRITGDAMIYGLGTIIARAISFFLLPLYTRMLAPAEYAQVDVLLTFNSILVIIALLGIDWGLALIFQMEDQARQCRVITSNLLFQFIWSCLLTGGLVLWSTPISEALLGQPNLAGLTVLMLLMLPFQGLFAFSQNLHKWKHEPVRFAFITVGLSLLVAVSNLILVVSLGWGAKGVLLGILLSYAALGVIGLWSVSRYLIPGFALGDVRAVLFLGIPFALAGAVNYLLPNINRVFLVNLVGLNNTGIYAAGLKICSVLLFMDITFNIIYYPYALSIQQRPGVNSIYAAVSRVYALIGMAAATCMFLFAYPLVQLIVGSPKYFGASKLVGPLLLALWIGSLRTTFGLGLPIARKTYHLIWAYGVAALLSLPVNFILIKTWGIQGAAYATVGIELILTALVFLANQWHYFIPFEIKPLAFLGFAYLALMLTIDLSPFPQLTGHWGVRTLAVALFLVIISRYSGAIQRGEIRETMALVRKSISKGNGGPDHRP
jgi:O-antigen/teichoic acid export membrane protein